MKLTVKSLRKVLKETRLALKETHSVCSSTIKEMLKSQEKERDLWKTTLREKDKQHAEEMRLLNMQISNKLAELARKEASLDRSIRLQKALEDKAFEQNAESTVLNAEIKALAAGQGITYLEEKKKVGALADSIKTVDRIQAQVDKNNARLLA